MCDSERKKLSREPEPGWPAPGRNPTFVPVEPVVRKTTRKTKGEKNERNRDK